MKNNRIGYFLGQNSFDRQAVTHLLQLLGIGLRVIPGGLAGLAALQDSMPGCVLIDLDSTEVGDIGSVAAPASGRRAMPIVVISAHADVPGVIGAMRFGACDYLLKPLDRAAFSASMARVFERLGSDIEAYSLRQQSRDRIESLSDREHDVLKGLFAGHANKALAHKLGISTRTVEMHRSRLMTKLGVQNLVQTIRMAVGAGIDLELRGNAIRPGALSQGGHTVMTGIAAERRYG